MKAFMNNTWPSLAALDTTNAIQIKLKKMAREQEKKWKKAVQDHSFKGGKASGKSEMLQRVLLEFEQNVGAVPKTASAAIRHTTGLSREGNPCAGPMIKAYSSIESQKKDSGPLQQKTG
jgi:hypothetical protein